jgi:hypothetical protein
LLIQHQTAGQAAGVLTRRSKSGYDAMEGLFCVHFLQWAS